MSDLFENPMGLIGLVQQRLAAWRLRPDHKLVVKGEWDTPDARLGAAEKILTDLAKVAKEAAT